MRTYVIALGCWLLLLPPTALAAVDATFQILSGSVPVHFYSYGDRMAHVPILQNFMDVMNGPEATVMPTNVNGWGPLPSPYAAALPVFNMTADYFDPDPTAGSSSLFGVPFSLPEVNLKAASIEFVFSVDNNLGGVDRGVDVQGLYLNGTALSGDTRFFVPDEEFPATRFFENERIFRDDIVPYLMPNNQNWLFMSVRDFMPQAGIVFGSSITYSSNPEPATLVMWSVLGLCGVVVVTRRRRRHAG